MGEFPFELQLIRRRPHRRQVSVSRHKDLQEVRLALNLAGEREHDAIIKGPGWIQLEFHPDSPEEWDATQTAWRSLHQGEGQLCG